MCASTERSSRNNAVPLLTVQGGFGLDSGFGGGGGSPRGNAFGAEDSAPPKHVASTNFAPSGDDEPAPAPSRQRTGDASGDRPSRGGAPPSRPPPAEILGEDSKKFVGVSRRKQEQLARGDDEVSRKNLKYETLTAGVDGIMEIPELEEEGREDLSNIVRGEEGEEGESTAGGISEQWASGYGGWLLGRTARGVTGMLNVGGRGGRNEPVGSLDRCRGLHLHS